MTLTATILIIPVWVYPRRHRGMQRRWDTGVADGYRTAGCAELGQRIQGIFHALLHAHLRRSHGSGEFAATRQLRRSRSAPARSLGLAPAAGNLCLSRK